MATETAFHEATLSAVRPAGHGLVWLALHAPTHLAIAHRHPGQYIQVRTSPEAKPSFMALANAPGEAWGLLVKDEGAGAALAALPEGSPLELTVPMGPGFPVDDFQQGRDLLFVGVGTGLAPLRSALREALTKRAYFGRLVWLAGAKDAASMPFTDELADWRSAGVELHLAYSQATLPNAHRGYVQDRLAAATGGSAAPFAALVCGMPAMESAVREGLTTLGLPADAFYRNF